MKKNLLLLFFFLAYISYSQINTNNIEIVRDSFGVPHIFGKTDEETAFGLAWAHAEDDFQTIQKTFLPAKSLSGNKIGQDGLFLDYAVELLRCRDVAKREIKNLSPKVKKVISGYIEGLNAYANKYPKKVLVKNSFPINMIDYLTGYNLILHLFSDTGDVLDRLLSNNIDPIENLNGVNEIKNDIGSNAFAFSSKKTLDGKTYLNINTHQPLEGPFSWYEAHLISEEGWNMLGGLFPGTPFPTIGTNENLGWTHTYNYPDLVDIYQLEINSNNENQYKYDEKWIDFEKKDIILYVKIFLGIKKKIKKTVLWSNYGPVIKNDKGYFSFYTPTLNNISSVEQWYKMNKAKNFNQFESALKLMGIPRFNIVYADKKDNIFYMSNARLPIRNKENDWTKLLLGNTSSLKLIAHHPYEDLPKLLNPKSGYLFNTNNSPFNSTHSSENLRENDYISTFSFREKENNRSIRFMELIKNYDKISYEDFQKIKYDQKYPDSLVYSYFDLNNFFSLDKEKYPEYKKLISLIQNWNREGDINNIGAAQWRIYYKFIHDVLKEKKYQKKDSFKEEYHIEAMKRTQKYLKKHFGGLNIRLGDFQRHTRGNMNFPVSGLNDMIAPSEVGGYKKGRVRAVSGESYIMLIRYSNEKIEIETVTPYGNSNNPKSKHYTDQMRMYINKTRKKMTLNKEEIYNNAIRIYNPK